MRKTLGFIFFFFMIIGLNAQDFNLELLANVPNTEETGEGNDIWAYIAPDNTEYAVIGHVNGTAIYDLTKPADPELVKFIPGSPSIWRDIKHFNEKVYVTTDQRNTDDGLLIIDMSMAPDSISFEFWKPIILDDPLETCHNLYIDEKGFLYLTGCADFRVSNLASGGVLMFDLKLGDYPVFLNALENRYSHDIFVQNDIAYASNIYVGEFSIWDVADKSNPILLGRQATSSTFTHNAWASLDGNFLFTTDELAKSNIDAYDISDPDNIERIDTYRPKDTEAFNVVPHNTHYLNGYLVNSFYTDGVKILDAHRPSNLIEVGSYDTFFAGNSGTNGCWGTTPFLPSGLVLASDISNGLFVLKPTYQRACYLEGFVKELNTETAIQDVAVEIESSFINGVASSFDGSFKTGQAMTGSFDVSFTHPEYYDTTFTVELLAGEVVDLEVFMRKLPFHNLKATVVDDVTGLPIQGAQIEIKKNTIVTNVLSNFNGEIDLSFIQGNIEIATAIWGYKFDLQTLDLNEPNTIEIRLIQGYEDNFYAALGWELKDDTDVNGAWEWVVPVGTSRGGVFINPGFDSPNDYGDRALITGNAGGNTRFDDVDGGPTIIQSPKMDLSNYTDPILEFEVWRWVESNNNFNREGLRIAIVSGDEKVYLDTIDGRVDNWDLITIDLNDVITLTDSMHISFEAEDDSSGNDFRTEIGIDNFKLFDGNTIGTSAEFINDLVLNIAPNPFQDGIEINFVRDEIVNKNIKFDIFNIMGQKMEERQIDDNLNTITVDTQNYPKGLYFIQLSGNNWKTRATKMIKQ